MNWIAARSCVGFIAYATGRMVAAIHYVPQLQARERQIDNLLAELAEQDRMDEAFLSAANRYKVK